LFAKAVVPDGLHPFASRTEHGKRWVMFATRFAPSPTGLLHLGHALSAITAFDAAQAVGGRFVLRIEDTDLTRCRPEFECALLEDLAWLGLEWENPVRRQSEHFVDYTAMLARLEALGVVYRCFKTRKEVMADLAGAPHGWPEAVRGGPLSTAEEATRIAHGEPFAIRLWLDRCRDVLGQRWEGLGFTADAVWTKAEPERTGDAVIARKEFPASYHLASVHDDALQGITHVIRGDDLRDAPHLHVLLQALLDLPTPVYRHHRLMMGADGKRLAKRDAAMTLRALRTAGATPNSIRRQVGL
jgi:glutamyl-Q tRNA(Asp) synthetase